MTVLLFAAAFCVIQRGTVALRPTTLWTPGALAFTALLLAPPRRWWIYFIGLCLGVFAAFYGDSEIPVEAAMLAVPFYFGTVALGAWGVRRFGANPLFGNLPSLIVFIVIGAVVVPVFTAAPVD